MAEVRNEVRNEVGNEVRKEYIEREAVLDKRRKVTEYDEAAFAMSYQAVPVEDIEAIPAADVVEVCRCKECEYLTVHNSPTLYAYCEKTHYRFEPFQTDTRTHFCSYGERKGDCNKCNNHSNERKGGEQE